MKHQIKDLSWMLNLAFGPALRKPKWPPKACHPRLPRAFLMTDTRRLPNPLKIIKFLPHDVTIIFRHYGHSRRKAIAHQLVAQAHRRNIAVLISGDFQLARRTLADGVHLPSHMLANKGVRLIRNAPPYWLITAAVHNHRELKQASNLGVNAALLSPVFNTLTHSNRRSLGLIGLQRLTSVSLIPTFALGGIKFSTAIRLKNSGTVGFGGIGEFQNLMKII